jgi:AcrR family transcriptional regulator
VSALRQRTRAGPSADALSERLAEAIVALTGTHGYEATTVEAICARAELPLEEFERRFAGKEECFLFAYDRIVAAFAERVMQAYETPSAWHDKLWAAAWAAFSFLREDPRRARFFVVEVNKAGARAQARHDRAMEAFVDLIDAGRSHAEDPDGLSRGTAEMAAGSIYVITQNKILEGRLERGENFLVDLVYLAVLPYLGARAAAAELRVKPLREPL